MSGNYKFAYLVLILFNVAILSSYQSYLTKWLALKKKKRQNFISEMNSVDNTWTLFKQIIFKLWEEI